MLKLNAKQLRKVKPRRFEYSTPLVFVLDNIQDTYNTGSFFRLADAVGAQKIYLCGNTVTPPNPKIHRASVGLWRWMPWEYHRDLTPLILSLKKEGFEIIVVEQDKNSVDYGTVKAKGPVALVLGHESKGVSEQLIKLADRIIEIPLLGVNRSLNVLVAASVVAYHLLASFPKKQ